MTEPVSFGRSQHHRPLARGLQRLLRLVLRVRVEGLENWRDVQGPALVIANHVSFLDGILLAAIAPCPLMFGITPEFAERQPWNAIFRLLRRGRLIDFRSIDPTTPHAIRCLMEHIRHGGWSALFPEGRVGNGIDPGPMFAGAGFIAERTGAVLLPVRISGAERCIFSRYPHRRHPWPRIIMTVYPPARLSSVEGRTRNEQRRHLSEQVERLLG
ncbi:MAG TPA: 1-acyl-sn-glycerol-3-phosphate acyltransferase [Candidatus Competibacteraceae bacterium]|nr:1-acyl-sn-glycerol-3-phosphate acyltransferase [Candidatus Competibacteraceae bacterium]